MELAVDGKRVHAATGGKDFDPALPVILFAHGAGMDHTVWVLQSRYFAYHGRSVLAVDMPGRGRSQGPLLPTIGDMAEWLMAVLDAAGVERAALVGHSMGALAALEAATRRPESVAALALLGIAVPMPVNPALLEAAKANEHVAADLVNTWGHARLAHLGGHRAPGLWMLGDAIRLLERAADGVLYNDLNACNEYTNGDAAAAGVDCPILLLLGENDIMTPPRCAQGIAAARPEVRTVVLAESGHMLMAERPDEVLDALLEVL